MSITRITPQLRTTDMASTIRFYTEKLGFTVEFNYENFYVGIRAGGQTVHLKQVDETDPSIPYVDEAKLGFSVENRNDQWRWAMLRFDECRLMVDQSINVHPEAPRQGLIYLYPDDIEKYHERVRSTGLEIPDLETTFYGLTEFRLDDPDGNRLWIGQNSSGRTE